MERYEEYSYKRNQLLKEMERSARQYLRDNNVDSYFADNMPFFKDGVVCPKQWFGQENQVRPLFIMKEVNTGLNLGTGHDIRAAIDAYNTEWNTTVGESRTIELTQDKYQDIQIGKFQTWKKVVLAAYGILELGDYMNVNLNAEISDDVPPKDVPGFQKGKYKYRTKNGKYLETVDRIAVINLKKIGGGKSTASRESDLGLDYMQHAEAMKCQLAEQILLIDPTVIIVCCGKESAEIKSKICECPTMSGKQLNYRWIESGHPGNWRVKPEDFARRIIENYKTQGATPVQNSD